MCQEYHKKNMKVAVRIKPLKISEGKSEDKSFQSNQQRSILRVTDGALTFDPIDLTKNGFYYHGKKQTHRDITVVNKNLSFKFDEIFDDGAQNRDVFERLLKPLVHSLMDGVNSSFLSYGATGTGKTHSILGNSTQSGIAYLTMEYVFFQLNKRVSNEWIYEVKVSYVEVYNEKVNNLLAKSKPLTITQKCNGDVKIDGLSMRKVNNLNEVKKLLTMGNRNRTRNFSDANTHSDQSNAIFQVYINAPNKLFNGNATDNNVKLLIVELGGSERNSVEGTRPNSSDAAKVNKAILTLKNCLHRLADGSKNIPFNDSHLTKILKNSLNNKCLTAILFNISPSGMNYNDTYNTLMYANKAQMIGKASERPTIPIALPLPSNSSTCKFVNRNDPHTSSTIPRPPNKSLYTECAATADSSKKTDEQNYKRIPKRVNSSENNTEINELTRWYYEINTIYDAVKAAVEGYCTNVSKEKLLELRLRCKEDVEICRDLLLSGQSNRMAKVRVKSVLQDITKQANVIPSKTIYWKRRLQICQKQIYNLHRKVKTSNFDDILESYISMKELEVAATKAYYESMHAMKTNAIYVNKTEINGYLSMLSVHYEANMMSLQEVYKNSEKNSFEAIEIDDINLPLYKNYSTIK